MVKYNPRTWLALIFHPYSRQVVKTLFPALAAMGVYTALIIFLIDDYFGLEFESTTVVHSLLGIVLGLFLVFRINSAYDRWWEGRKFWGSLLNNSRNLATRISVMLPQSDKEIKNEIGSLIAAFAASLRLHLKDKLNKESRIFNEFPIIADLVDKEHIPNAIIWTLTDRINRLYLSGKLSGKQLFLIDKDLKELSDILGGCERIKNTPIPYSYSMYIKKFIFTYTITLPFAFITEFGYVSIPIVLLIFFILVSVELVAEEIEDPFGNDANDLPTKELSEKIKRNVYELMAD
ncbi:bestrophin family ion channel [Marivirga atlantica]|uniref:Bestrophin, RFP-TM, chloride channel n=1 Tax=Marivirga atlantica TaxID=1548457 RepID=A0A937DIE6_9BACT|nr:bestrophin family ion channel [Marivirga atlantica]MBL0764091.1 hypothetical protein [Marivirga atlantica]